MKRISMKFSIVSTVCLASITALAKVDSKPSHINVVYILADDLGYGDLGCYGQKIIKTPNIDKLAKNGMLFTQHYAGCTVCAPSRCSLMTGLHTGHTQVRGNKEIKPEGQTPMEATTFTIAKLFKESGYTTGMFGKWGLGFPGSASTPNKMGFDEFYGYNCQKLAHSYYPEYLWHNDQKVMFTGNENLGRKIYSADSIQIHALQFIRENKQKPFFAMLTYTIPHAELSVPKDSIYNRFSGKFEETPFIDNGASTYHSSEEPKASFAAMVERLDLYVGEVIRELQIQGVDKNTIVIFTSDNGPHREGGADPDFFKSYGPLRGVKRDLYEGGIRVPMIAYSPGLIKSGSKTNQICAFWDIMPTFSELLNVKLPIRSDGISFLPTLKGKNTQEQHPYLYWEFHELGGKVAVRMGKWKGVKLNYGEAPDCLMELYDLNIDIHEDNNVAAKHPEIVAQIESIIKKAHIKSDTFNFGRN
jgi:arylsulfatase A-like enzyme